MLLCQLFEKAPKFSLLDKMPKRSKVGQKLFSQIEALKYYFCLLSSHLIMVWQITAVV